jgi:hypothetical protein
MDKQASLFQKRFISPVTCSEEMENCHCVLENATFSDKTKNKEE